MNKSKLVSNLVEKNPFFCADAQTANKWSKWLEKIRKEGNSAGAVIEVMTENVPKGLGSPIYQKLEEI